MATMTVTQSKLEPILESFPIVEGPSQWADAPYALIPEPLQDAKRTYKDPKTHAADLMAHDMTQLHNMLLRGLNSIWQQAPYVTAENDIKDFLTYGSLWCDFMHHHHETEEQNFFPAIEALVGIPGCMEGNVEQHKAFEGGLEAMIKYCKETTPATYSATDLCNLIDSFAPTLRQHLADEIPSMQSLRQYDSEKLKAIWKAAGEYSRNTSDSAASLPFIIGTHDFTFEGNQVGEFTMPFFVYWLNNMAISRKYAKAWRFLPCDGKGHPQPLAFGPYRKTESQKTGPQKKEPSEFSKFMRSPFLNDLFRGLSQILDGIQ